MQVAAPARECVPAAHVMQEEIDAEEMTEEYEPAAQSVQATVPVDSAYVPPGQGMHCVEPATE